MYESIRALHLSAVISMLGVSGEFKTRKGGTEYYGKCPLHDAKRNTTSFSFDNTGRFHCFSCGKKGRGAIDVVMAFKGCGFQEAVEWLSSQQTLPQSRHVVSTTPTNKAPNPLVTIEPAENQVYRSSYEKFKVESDWLKKRGLTQETLDRYGVFQYENPKRRSAYNGNILLPIRRFRDGEVVGYLVRFLQGEVKYLFPKGVSKSLEVFGSYQLREQTLPLRVGYLVESPFAVMKFHQLGFPAVSCYGWSVSPEQVSILTQLARGWVYLPDANKRDSIGQVLHQLSQKCWVKCPEYPADDPEHLTAEQIRSL